MRSTAEVPFQCAIGRRSLGASSISASSSRPRRGRRTILAVGRCAEAQERLACADRVASWARVVRTPCGLSLRSSATANPYQVECRRRATASRYASIAIQACRPSCTSRRGCPVGSRYIIDAARAIERFWYSVIALSRCGLVAILVCGIARSNNRLSPTVLNRGSSGSAPRAVPCQRLLDDRGISGAFGGVQSRPARSQVELRFLRLSRWNAVDVRDAAYGSAAAGWQRRLCRTRSPCRAGSVNCEPRSPVRDEHVLVASLRVHRVRVPGGSSWARSRAATSALRCRWRAR
jgi:hypothetical protein